MKCTNCGREIDKSAKFCKYCGAPVTQETQETQETIQCPHCGAVIGKENKFCTNCGNLLRRMPESGTDDPKTIEYSEKKSGSILKVVAILAAFIVVLLAIVFIAGAAISRFGNQSADDQLSPERTSENLEESFQIEDLMGSKYESETTAPHENMETTRPRESEETPETPFKFEVDEPTAAPSEFSEETTEESSEAQETEENVIHRYDYIIDDCTWNEAFYKAQELGGYLVRLDSPEEYLYVVDEITQFGYDNIQFRIGGRRDAGGTQYYWVDETNHLFGEPLNDPSNWIVPLWLDGEPSYQDGATEEMYLDIYYNEARDLWLWNDVPDDILAVAPYFSGKIGYIVEYEN